MKWSKRRVVEGVAGVAIFVWRKKLAQNGVGDGAAEKKSEKIV